MSTIADTAMGGEGGHVLQNEEDRSGEYAALRALAGEVLAGLCPPSVVRAAWESGGRTDPALWGGLRSAGFTAVAVPVAHGGLGLGEPGLAVVARAAGRAALPGPLLDSGLAALAIADWGTEAQRSRWLPPLAEGDATATVALGPGDLVSHADTADVLVLVDGDQVHVVERGRFTCRQAATADGARRMFLVEAEPGPATAAARDPAAGERILDQGAAVTAATLDGVSARLLDMTRDYVCVRRQFGRPVGMFQAVKHRLADAYVATAMTWPTCWDAVVALDGRASDASVRAGVAKVFASDAAASVNDHALQCHGGIGFSWENDLHLWLKRGKALEHAYGSSRFHRRRIGAVLFGAAAAP